MTIGQLVDKANEAYDAKEIGYESTPERSIFIDGVIEGYALRCKELNEENDKCNKEVEK